MKLLGWMHRKFRQNITETPKDFSIGVTGQPSMEDLFSSPWGNHNRCNKLLGRGRNSYTYLETLKDDEEFEVSQEPPPTELTELFHGFLAIGTLGTEPITTDPGTPTFSITVDDIAEKETQVTENELKLINEELEKLLGAELKEESCYSSSGRNSHVSAGRISHCSTITLSGKSMEDGNGAIICPLRSYLLGSAMEQQSEPEKKGHRVSLGELFQKTKIAEENYSGNKSEKRFEKEGDRSSAVHLMKKILKKRTVHASSKGATCDSVASETKLHKILHIFNRKVHPEESISSNQTQKPIKNGIKNNDPFDEMQSTEEHITIYPNGRGRAFSKYTSNPYHLLKTTSDATGNEFWVKTDADYLVLEL